MAITRYFNLDKKDISDESDLIISGVDSSKFEVYIDDVKLESNTQIVVPTTTTKRVNITIKVIDSSTELNNDDIPTVIYSSRGVYTSEEFDEISDDKKSSTLTFGGKSSISSDVFFNIPYIQKIIKKVGISTIYKVSDDTLNEIKNQRFVNISSTSQSYDDLGNYITSLKKFLCDFSSDTSTDNIILGKKSINVDSSKNGVFNENIKSLDFGTININEINNNASDYKDTLIDIYLPFCNGYNKLDTSKYMNKSINLIYLIDLIGGNCKAQLKVNDVIQDEFNGVISFDIPFATNNFNNMKNVLNYNTDFLTYKIPFVRIIYNDNEQINTFNNVSLNGILKDFSGLVQIDYCNINDIDNCNSYELSEIENLLNSGVII